MNKYEVTATSISSFYIDVDPEVWNGECLKEWESSFYPAPSTKYIAEYLAESLHTQGLGRFYEGFGYVKTFYSDGSEYKQYNSNGKVTEFAGGIKVVIDYLDEREVESMKRL